MIEEVLNEVIGFGLIVLLAIFVIFPLLFCLCLLSVLEIEYLFKLILGS